MLHNLLTDHFSRARKLDRGILIIRFEMPYNIWCDGCKKHIGMGVRYNAEKTKLGMYYTTPIYQFRMKCHLCPNKITIKTDPGNMDYIITEGARRVEQRWDPSTNGQIVPDDKSIGRKLADDAMFKLEHDKKDKDKSTDAAPRISQLSQIQDRVKDDWLANKMLRDQFRAKKKEKKEKLMKDKEILSKCGLEMDLVEEREEDVRMAHLLNVQSKTNADERRTEERVDITNGSIFSRKTTSNPSQRETNGDKKLIALKTLGKASKSKQSDLLKSKGFGLVVGKAKERSSEIFSNLVQEKSTSSSSIDISESQNTSVENYSIIKESSNSLSMLFSQNDNCSDDNEET